MITEIFGVSVTATALRGEWIDRQRLRPDIDQRDPERARAGAQEMLAEDAAQLDLERLEIVWRHRFLRVPAVRELRVESVAEESRS